MVSKPVDSARAPDLKPCEACGHHHGSVGAHIECLNGHIRFLRGRIPSRTLPVCGICHGDGITHSTGAATALDAAGKCNACDGTGVQR